MFSQKLKFLRKSKNLTQSDMANMLGITRQGYGKYESSDSQPDLDTLEKLASYFDVSTDYLLGRTDSPTSSHIDKDEEEFQAFANDPSLQKWYKELPKSKEEDLRKLRKMWEILKDSNEI